jgi:uncharacterized membrane protein (DUF373 family)
MTNICNKLPKDYLTFLETIIAFIGFSLTVYFSEEHIEIGFTGIISLVLYFMIFIELTRALFDFILGDEHKFKVRYIYDLSIIFLIREILVAVTSNHHHIQDELVYLGVSTTLLIVLFILRIVDAKVFNYVDKCNSCSHSYDAKS